MLYFFITYENKFLEKNGEGLLTQEGYLFSFGSRKFKHLFFKNENFYVKNVLIEVLSFYSYKKIELEILCFKYLIIRQS